MTRTEPGIVLWWAPEVQEWDTLYWFNAEPGDKWSPGWEKHYPWLESCLDSAYLQVVDTGTMVVDGLPLRTLKVERVAGSDVDHTFTIMERVGNTNEFFFPDPPPNCFMNEALNLFICYGDDQIRYPPSTQPCGLTMEVTEVGNHVAESWNVFPVPFRDHLNVQAAYPQPGSTVSLLDMTGRVLLHAPFNGSVLELDASGLPAGVYLLRLVDQQGRSSHRKAIKE